ELSTDRAAQGRRALDAAQEHAVAGHVATALALLEQAEPRIEPQLGPALARLRGNLAMRRGEPHAALQILHGEADRALAAGDHGAAAALLLESSIGYTMTGDPDGMFTTLERASVSAAQAGGPAALIVRIMLAVSGMVVGRAREGAADELARIEPLLAGLDPSGLSEPLGLYAQASLWRDRDRAERTLDWLIGRYREASAFGALPFPLTVRAMLNERRGRWAEAEADAEEAVRLAREIDQATIAGFCLSTLVNVEAGLGRVDDARAHAREALELLDAARARNLAIYVNAALGRAELAADRPEEAIGPLELAAREAVALGWREPNVVQFAGDRVEALVRLGREEEARTALAALADDVALTGCAWGAAVLERGRMLLAPPDELDACAVRGLDLHMRDGGPFERARTELAWGERLRRRRRRMDAREPLERALATFRALGAAPWARRAAD
ncbi:hypothetical protein Q5424_29025, partial [Conexibacter sp. JD483]